MKNLNGQGMNRRQMLRMGALGSLGLADILRLQSIARAEQRPKRDLNCIFLFIVGGMPHQDMWDLKPEAPAEVRGDFRPIDTVVPGIQLGDVIPGMAKVADKFAILRGMTHDDSDHGRGFHVMMTGKKAGAGDFNGNQNNNQHPCFGSIVSRFGKSSALPPYISVPNFLNSGGPSFLGASHGPFVIAEDPAAPQFAVRDITLPPGISNSRNAARQAALRDVNQRPNRPSELGDDIAALDRFYEKAYGIMTSRRAREAFEIHRETDETRAAYGMTSIGQCCLLARRLVEAGCRFVSIENGHWDTHRKNTWSLREVLCPSFDQAVPALLTDLSDRGLLDETLLVVTTEFGRTPRINDLAGRDHWPNAFSICMAGAGIRPAQVIGRTDRQAGMVVDRPISPQDMAATILHLLGIDYQHMMHTPLGRPVPIVDGGKPVRELFA